MNGTIHAEEPSYATDGNGNNKGGVAYDVGFSFVVILFITILIYASYMCKQRSSNSSRSAPHQLHTSTNYDDSDDSQCMRCSSGLDDEVLSTFPTFLYSETKKKKPDDHHNIVDDDINETSKSTTTSIAIDYGSGCSICLADYKPMEVLKLLPECGHLFHVKCIDTWLKVQSTCPVCRNSPLSTSTDLTLTQHHDE
uniref:RING-H2 finger protein ATL70-like n=1 Tax=Erigeron canadensis TaxID=72917 RepID=UPI001CB9BF8F|nr:RING-H2 finger protein ATL70-like [Erigeron canadensis]